MNLSTHRTIYNQARGCLMAVAETTNSNGKASGESRSSQTSKSKNQTCRKARSALCSGGVWLQANQDVGYGLPCLQGTFNSALTRSQYERFAASQLGSDPFAPRLAFSGTPLAFGVRPHLFAASQLTTTSQDAVVTNTNPGQIRSGGAMTLAAANTLVNQQSHIIAGGNLGITGRSIDNQGLNISLADQRSGTTYYWRNYNEGCGRTFGGCDYDYRANGTITT